MGENEFNSAHEKRSTFVKMLKNSPPDNRENRVSFGEKEKQSEEREREGKSARFFLLFFLSMLMGQGHFY